MQKTGSFWLGQKEAADNKTLFFASDSVLIESFLSVLKRLATVYEISDRKSLEAYGLEKVGAFVERINRHAVLEDY